MRIRTGRALALGAALAVGASGLAGPSRAGLASAFLSAKMGEPETGRAGGIPLPAITPSEGQDVVYIYRPRAMGFALRGSTFSVDNIKAAVLGYNGCTALLVPPGHHVIKQQWPFDIGFGRADTLAVNWEPGRTYYYKFLINGRAEANVIRMVWSLGEVDEGEGRRGVQDCRFTAPANLDKLTGDEALAPKPQAAGLAGPAAAH